jgi:hypothetical protein
MKLNIKKFPEFAYQCFRAPPKRTLKLIFSLSLLFLNSCASIDSIHNKKGLYREAIYPAAYEKVWRAAEKSLENYVLANNNSESGIIQTDWIRGDDIWNPPTSQKKPSSGQRQKLTLFFTKGKSNGTESVRIQIKKEAEILMDFVSEPETLISDGLEELNILYRIERELNIARSINRLENKRR